MENDKTLHLVLKRKWYDMIDSGIKTEEYREIKPYWEKRLLDYKSLSDIDDAPHHFPRGYKKVVFCLGYQRNAPSMAFEVRDICFGKGKPEWGAPTDKEVFIIKLGKRIII